MLTRKPEIGKKLIYDRDGEVYRVTDVNDCIVHLLSLETGQKTCAIWKFKDSFNNCFSET